MDSEVCNFEAACVVFSMFAVASMSARLEFHERHNGDSSAMTHSPL